MNPFGRFKLFRGSCVKGYKGLHGVHTHETFIARGWRVDLVNSSISSIKARSIERIRSDQKKHRLQIPICQHLRHSSYNMCDILSTDPSNSFGQNSDKSTLVGSLNGASDENSLSTLWSRQSQGSASLRMSTSAATLCPSSSASNHTSTSSSPASVRNNLGPYRSFAQQGGPSTVSNSDLSRFTVVPPNTRASRRTRFAPPLGYIPPANAQFAYNMIPTNILLKRAYSEQNDGEQEGGGEDPPGYDGRRTEPMAIPKRETQREEYEPVEFSRKACHIL